MGLLSRWCDGSAETALWRLRESSEELSVLCPLSSSELETCVSFRNEQRRREWLASRVLLRELMGAGRHILYRSSGRPHLEGDGRCVSISHTRGFVALRLSTLPVAIDVEYRSGRARRLFERFAAPGEAGLLEGRDEETTAMIIWSAKEALFKLFDLPGVDFQRHLLVERLEGDGRRGTVMARVRQGRFEAPARLHYAVDDELVMVYA